MLLTADRSEASRRRIQQAVEAALTTRKVSGRRASLDVVGHDGLIRDIRSGVIPSADRLEVLFEYLGLEFYFGPRRETAPVEHTFVDGFDFAAIPLYDARLAAGPGSNNEGVELVEMLAFRTNWLRELDVSPSNAVLVKVTGDSMEPNLHSGDLVLIDRGRRQVKSGRVYAFTEGQDARVKRIERVDADTLALRSDNPLHPLELRRGGDINMVKVIGQVVWSGHVW
jgi:SOS-response transcriptional repressor LexA